MSLHIPTQIITSNPTTMRLIFLENPTLTRLYKARLHIPYKVAYSYVLTYFRKKGSVISKKGREKHLSHSLKIRKMSCRKQIPNIFSVPTGNGYEKPEFRTGLPRSKITIWTNEYGSSQNFFPANLVEIYSHRHSNNSMFELPMVNAKHGRKLDDDFLLEYEHHFQNIPTDEQHASILLLGNENVSMTPIWDANGQNDVIQYTRKILQMHEKSQHPCLVLTLVPLGRQDQFAFLTARQTDYLLGGLVRSFLDLPCGHLFGVEYTALWFQEKEQVAPTENELAIVMGDFIVNSILYQDNGVDLTPRGAYTLAGHICEAAERLISNYRMGPRK